jgi:hypothetical protein
MYHKLIPRSLAILISLTIIAISVPSTSAVAQATPVLDVNPDTLNFYVHLCEDTVMMQFPEIAGFMVANIGGGDMIWSGSADLPWVVFEPMHGGNFDSVAVWIDREQLSPPITPPQAGDTIYYQSTITIEAEGAENSPQSVTVLLGFVCPTDDINLIVYPDMFEIVLPSDVIYSDWFYVSEAGGAHVMFSYSNNSNWLFLPVTFAPVYTPDSVEMGISTEGLEPGLYVDTIFIMAGEYEPLAYEAIPVMLTVSDESPFLATIPEFFNIVIPAGEPLPGESLYVYEINDRSINFVTYNSQYWLHIDTMSSSPLFTPELLPLHIYADTLEPGIYYDTILVYGEGAINSPLAVPVSLTIEGEVPPYQVTTSPRYFEVTLPPEAMSEESVEIYEVHGRPVSFIVAEISPWLQITNISGPITSAVVDFSISTQDLTPGFYSDTLFIFPDTDGVSFPPEAVAVFLHVTGDEFVVMAEPDHFAFNLNPGESSVGNSVYVYEQQGANITYAAETLQGSFWLYLRQDTTGEQMTPGHVIFDIYSGGLTPGSYVDTIVIYYPLDDIYGFDEVIVPVELNIQGEPPPYSLQVTPYSFYFYLHPGGIEYDTLYVSETYDREVAFGYHNYAPWLTVNPMGMPPYITPMALPIIANATGLEPGAYIDTIFVGVVFEGEKSSMVAVPVIMIVHDDPPPYTLEVTPEFFSFNLEPGDVGFDTLFVSEAYDRMAPFGYHNYAPWLAVNPLGMPPYVTPMALPIAVSTVDLDPGIYHDTIFVGLVFDSLRTTMVATPVFLSVGGAYLAGDANGDEDLNVGDVLYLINYIFRGGPAPDPLWAADADCNGLVNIGDAVNILFFIFKNGPEPGCP